MFRKHAGPALSLFLLVPSPLLAQTAAPGRVSRIEATCSRIMGLRPGEYYYAACKDSLGQSLAGKTEGETTLANGEACRRQGYAEGSAELAACVLDRRNVSAAQPQMAEAGVGAQLSYPSDALQSGRSYYAVAPSVHWQREQYSCAQLGLMPGSGAFGHCVTSLNAALLPDMN